MWVWIVVAVFLLLAVGIGLFALRREPPLAPAPVIQTDEQGDLAARRARQAVLEPIEQNLLARRIELDAKRGTLAGDSAVYDSFVELENRLRSGEIGEDEFEAEKRRLLGAE